MRPIRVAKLLLVSLIGLYALLVGYGNLVDYGSNYEFVRHVLMMDTTFPGNALRSRAIESPALHRIAYAMIIATELVCGLACVAGALRLAARYNAPAGEFDRGRGLAVLGLTLAFALWFGGFILVGGEWFLMWQSTQWNGELAAFRTAACAGIVLIFLCQPTPEEA